MPSAILITRSTVTIVNQRVILPGASRLAFHNPTGRVSKEIAGHPEPNDPISSPERRGRDHLSYETDAMNKTRAKVARPAQYTRRDFLVSTLKNVCKYSPGRRTERYVYADCAVSVRRNRGK